MGSVDRLQLKSCYESWEHLLVGGIPTPLKNKKVNWDDDIPNIWEKQVPKHQPDLDPPNEQS